MAASARPLVFVPVAALVLAACVGGGLWWWQHRHLVGTDDAYVQADVALVTSRIAGTVTEVAVDDNWHVKQGDLLVVLDPATYRLRLDSAQAALVRAQRDIEEARARVRAADSGVVLAEAELDLAKRDDARVEKLAAEQVVSVDNLDRARTALRVAYARLDAAREEAEEARAALGIPLDAPAPESPLVQRAQAAHDEAALQLSYTQVRAPIAGFVAAKGVQIGQHIEAGQPLMRIVPLSGAYVEANFKETQLAHVRIGQPVTIVADIYPDYEYHGVVDSLAPGTGAAFALLPPENATGNWIKVVQRVPVKIRLSEPEPAERPLRVGLSVMATIDTSRGEGPLLTPLNQTAKAPGEEAASAGPSR
jgi:membrane fusion protein (multidrug efflux system)